jgi:type VI secretion system protein ImpM
MGSDAGMPEIGFYGKLPAKGDFLTRHLPRDFVAVWDDWLQSGLNTSRAVLGDRWQNIYLTSPIWRYALSPGICGASGWLGLVLPSMDRVGRCFPFSVARALPAHQPPLEAASAHKDWLQRIEVLVLAALHDDDVDVSSLDESLTSATAECPDPAAVCDDTGPAPLTVTELSAGLRLPLQQDLDHLAVLREVASTWLRGHFAQYSIWWSEGSQIVSPSLLFCPGLPSAEQYGSLLDGSWSARGWSDRAASRSVASEVEPGATDRAET